MVVLNIEFKVLVCGRRNLQSVTIQTDTTKQYFSVERLFFNYQNYSNLWISVGIKPVILTPQFKTIEQFFPWCGSFFNLSKWKVSLGREKLSNCNF